MGESSFFLFIVQQRKFVYLFIGFEASQFDDLVVSLVGDESLFGIGHFLDFFLLCQLDLLSEVIESGFL